MQNHLMIRIYPDATMTQLEMQWCAWNQKNKAIEGGGQGDYAELKAWLEDRNEGSQQSVLEDAIVFLPGTLSLHYQMSLTDAQSKHISQVAPFMVEEFLSENIEQFHVPNKIIKKNQAGISVIHKETLNNLINQFEQLGLKPSNMLAETQLLNSKADGALVIILDLKYAHFCLPNQEAYTVSTDLVFDLVRDELQQQANTSDKTQEAYCIREMKLHYEVHDEALKQELEKKWSDLLNEHSIEYEAILQTKTTFHQLIESFFDNKIKNILVNLRSGPYVCYKQLKKQWHAWRWVAYIAIIGLVSQLLLDIFSIALFSYKADHFLEQEIALYREAFPNDKSVINIRGKLERKLKSINKKEPQQNFFKLMKAMSVGLNDNKALIVKNLVFSAGQNQITCTIEASSYEHFNNYVDALKKQNLKVKTENSNKSGNAILSKLVITL